MGKLTKDRPQRSGRIFPVGGRHQIEIGDDLQRAPAIVGVNSICDIVAFLRLEVEHMSPKRLTLDVDHMVELYEAGLSEKAVAEHFAVRRPAIRLRLVERREAVIDRAAIIEECAAIVRRHRPDASFDDSSAGYMERHALLDNVANEILALRSLPSNAPSLGEARLAEGEPVFTYTRTFNAIAAAVEWKPNNAFGISVRKFVEAFGPNPSHVQAEAGEAVVTTPPKISELANDLWEALFGIMRGAVPDDLTNEVLNQLAARMAVAYSISERAAP